MQAKGERRTCTVVLRGLSPHQSDGTLWLTVCAELLPYLIQHVAAYGKHFTVIVGSIVVSFLHLHGPPLCILYIKHLA